MSGKDKSRMKTLYLGPNTILMRLMIIYVDLVCSFYSLGTQCPEDHLHNPTGIKRTQKLLNNSLSYLMNKDNWREKTSGFLV